MTHNRSSVIAIIATLLAFPAAAQSIDEEGGEEIVVTGQRLRGAVIGDVAPEVRLSGGDVRALGVGSVSELLGALAPQTRSAQGSGAPVVLINGRRITGFSEVRDLPPEAIVRVEIFPEQVALKYGYRADQKLVNIVLRARFRAITLKLEPGLATAGGRETVEASLGTLRIDKDARTSVDVQYQHENRLLENERDIAPLVSDTLIDQRDYRSLLARSDQAALNASASRSIGDGVSATFNARLESIARASLLGAVPGVTAPVPLRRDADTLSGHVALALSGALARWQWSFTGNYDVVRNASQTDRASGNRDSARATSHALTTELVANGTLARLPAGDLAASVKLGFDATGLNSRSTRAGLLDTRNLDRLQSGVQANFDLPIADRGKAVLGGLGALSVNATIAADRVSDFGTLTSVGAGLNWSPLPMFDLIGAWSRTQTAPSMAQLGDPVSVTPDVQIYDFARAATVGVNRIDGGNAALRGETRRLLKLGATLRPLRETDLSLTANYTDRRTRHPIASFPALTPAIEAAFADRIVRDASGTLISIDARALNFVRSEQQQLRWGVNFSKSLGAAPTPASIDALRAARASGQRGAAGGRMRGLGGFGGRRARVQLALYHSWNIIDRVQLASGLAPLDLLDGGAIANSGGQPRHEIEVQAGYSKNGLGIRTTAEWHGATRVNGVTPADRLDYAARATFGLRLFADLGGQRKLATAHPWVRGMRISLSVDNVFASSIKVRDASGATPANYRPDRLDPLGRTLRLTIRKLFF